MPVVLLAVLVWKAKRDATVVLVKSARNNAPVPVAVMLPLVVGVVIVGDVAKTIPPEPVTAWPNAVWTPVPNDVMPVPPFAIASVPPSVIAPVVAVFGVKPVVPALNDVTPPVDAAHVAVVPFEVKT